MRFTESTVEQATLDWLAELGYAIAQGPEMAPGKKSAVNLCVYAHVGRITINEGAVRNIASTDPEKE